LACRFGAPQLGDKAQDLRVPVPVAPVLDLPVELPPVVTALLPPLEKVWFEGCQDPLPRGTVQTLGFGWLGESTVAIDGATTYPDAAGNVGDVRPGSGQAPNGVVLLDDPFVAT
jgi:hypothetical protein